MEKSPQLHVDVPSPSRHLWWPIIPVTILRGEFLFAHIKTKCGVLQHHIHILRHTQHTNKTPLYYYSTPLKLSTRERERERAQAKKKWK